MTKQLAFASDFDNTFLFHEGKTDVIRPEDLDAVHAFQRAGGLFGFCTGRNRTGITHFIPDTLVPDFLILSTGAHVLIQNDTVLQERAIPYEIAVALVQNGLAMQYREVSAQLAEDFYIVGKQRSAYGEASTIDSVEALRGKTIHTISYHVESLAQAQEITSDINARFGDDVIAYQNTVDIDIVPTGCSKGEGIRLIKDALHIDRFGGMGDSMNDLPMVEAVDVGFTFPTAPEGLRAAADHLVGGVAEALRMLLAQ